MQPTHETGFDSAKPYNHLAPKSDLMGLVITYHFCVLLVQLQQ